MSDYCKVHVVDMIMGSGKTSAALNYMNTNPYSRNYLYITPFLKEIERVKEACPELHFIEPQQMGGRSKLRDIKNLLSKGYNVVSTHALFRKFTPEIMDICCCNGYTLIMDEVTDVIEPFPISADDRKILFKELVTVDKDTGIIKWREDKKDYVGEFQDIKEKCDMGCLVSYGENSNILLWLLPVECFAMFDEVYILTYLFDAQIQRYYYDYFGLKYDYRYVEGAKYSDYKFTTKPTAQKIKYDYGHLINICDNVKLNKIGDNYYDLSKGWFKRNEDNKVVLPQLKNNIFNYFHNMVKSPVSNNIWTTFKDYKQKLSGKGYAKGFLPSNSRATNAYKDRTCLAYCLNRFIDPLIVKFFEKHDVTVSEEQYALSEMLQFIWRSAIREGKEINVYIPSKRMRDLLAQWIQDNPKNIEEE